MELNDEKEEMMAACRSMAERCKRMAARYDTNSRARTFLGEWRERLENVSNGMAMVDLETDYARGR